MVYYDQNQRMIDKQAELISKLNAENKQLRENLHAATCNKMAADFYFELQKSVRDNPLLQSEWIRFCSYLKMADPDVSRDDYD